MQNHIWNLYPFQKGLLSWSVYIFIAWKYSTFGSCIHITIEYGIQKVICVPFKATWSTSIPKFARKESWSKDMTKIADETSDIWTHSIIKRCINVCTSENSLIDKLLWRKFQWQSSDMIIWKDALFHQRE